VRLGIRRPPPSILDASDIQDSVGPVKRHEKRTPGVQALVSQ
jgi:hypothetical protein